MVKKVVAINFFGKKSIVSEKELQWRPSIYGLLIRNNKILLSRERGDYYDFPGGGMKIYENLDEALEREFWEETGLKVKRNKLVTVRQIFYRKLKNNKPCNFIMLYYLVRRVGGKLTTANFDDWEKTNSQLAEWINLKDIKKLKFTSKFDCVSLIKQAVKLQKR